MADPTFREALFWYSVGDGSSAIKCILCPWNCNIKEDSIGFCKVRKNIGGKLYSLVYGSPVALNVDPIEKKPLAMFMPRSWTFSIGTYGCNLDCSFCQNFHISKNVPDITGPPAKLITPEFIIKKTLETGCKSIAFTYNEPTIWIEYAIDIAKEAKKYGIPLVLVSNGYIAKDAREYFYPLIDAANIDVKGFSEEFYNSMTKGQFQPVLDSVKYLYQLGKRVEITNLIISGKNDSEEMIGKFLDWVESDLSKTVPIHFSAFFPTYKYFECQRTPPETLYRLRKYANGRGFTNIFLGNI